MEKVGEMVGADGSIEELGRPADADPETQLNQTQYEVSTHLRAIVAIAKHEAALYRDSSPVYARQMAVVRTKCEEALLYVLFGDRVG